MHAGLIRPRNIPRVQVSPSSKRIAKSQKAQVAINT
jgi:hypothetical protein